MGDIGLLIELDLLAILGSAVDAAEEIFCIAADVLGVGRGVRQDDFEVCVLSAVVEHGQAEIVGVDAGPILRGIQGNGGAFLAVAQGG